MNSTTKPGIKKTRRQLELELEHEKAANAELRAKLRSARAKARDAREVAHDLGAIAMGLIPENQGVDLLPFEQPSTTKVA